jgi:hypothetical protein
MSKWAVVGWGGAFSNTNQPIHPSQFPRRLKMCKLHVEAHRCWIIVGRPRPVAPGTSEETPPSDECISTSTSFSLVSPKSDSLMVGFIAVVARLNPPDGFPLGETSGLERGDIAEGRGVQQAAVGSREGSWQKLVTILKIQNYAGILANDKKMPLASTKSSPFLEIYCRKYRKYIHMYICIS